MRHISFRNPPTIHHMRSTQQRRLNTSPADFPRHAPPTNITPHVPLRQPAPSSQRASRSSRWRITTQVRCRSHRHSQSPAVAVAVAVGPQARTGSLIIATLRPAPSRYPTSCPQPTNSSPAPSPESRSLPNHPPPLNQTRRMSPLPPTRATHPPASTPQLTPQGRPNHSTDLATRHPIGAHTMASCHQTPRPNTTPYPRSGNEGTSSPPADQFPNPSHNSAAPPAPHLLNSPREDPPLHSRQPPTLTQKPTSPSTAQALTLGRKAVLPHPRHALKAAQSALTTLLFTAAAVLLLPTSPARASPPTWRWPLDGHPRVLRRFTPPPEPWLAGHRGIDLAAPPSTPVLAAGPGTVRFAGPVAGKGVVTVEHEGGLRTTYLPVKASVRRGQPVAPGSRLGVVGTPQGHCRESCLHWGLRRGTHYLDPLLLLGQATIRLLPFWHEDENPIPPANEHSLRDDDDHEHPLQPPVGEIARPPTTQPRRSPAALAPAPPATPNALNATPPTLTPAPPATPKALTAAAPALSPAPPPSPQALAATPPALTLITRATHSLPPNTSSPGRHNNTPSQRHPLAAANSLNPAASRGRHQAHSPTTTLDFLTRSASTTTTSAIGLGTLLGIGLLVTALRSHRRTRTDHHPRRRGQHRTTTGEERGNEATNTRHRGEKHPTPNRPTTTNAKPGRHRKTANHRN
ncbi:peptidoglycan DD-metalloendopeptidase family protein [Nonomuraea jabiensis]|uniref:M23 family metallopeptidase n=1 Tax=Nonomuraea jabiensis TaxID=882448 RepID=UPI00343B9CD9